MKVSHDHYFSVTCLLLDVLLDALHNLDVPIMLWIRRRMVENTRDCGNPQIYSSDPHVFTALAL